jgi:arginine utilization protein RocB
MSKQIDTAPKIALVFCSLHFPKVYLEKKNNNKTKNKQTNKKTKIQRRQNMMYTLIIQQCSSHFLNTSSEPDLFF